MICFDRQKHENRRFRNSSIGKKISHKGGSVSKNDRNRGVLHQTYQKKQDTDHVYGKTLFHEIQPE